VLVGPKVIAVGTRGEYPGWVTFSSHVKEIFQQFSQTGIVKQTVRLGLRYISSFPFDIFPKLQLRISVDDESWDGEETFFKTVRPNSGFKSLLQIGKGLALVEKPAEIGSIIDIDSFTTETDGEISAVLEKFLESAHHSEKELFFALLKPQFLETLNPVYDNAN
ncbi:MAG: TIGR04255 family protein, partial [Verrucomicrobia bacterium]|nr:TIGR04255 family protein [Verrucomicrobiota bacterium]